MAMPGHTLPLGGHSAVTTAGRVAAGSDRPNRRVGAITGALLLVASRSGRWQMTSFGILGPVHAMAGERRLPIGGPRQVKLLAVFLLRPNLAVSTDELIDTVWGSARTGAANRLQMAITRLRKALEPLNGDAAPRIRAVGGGYVLTVAPGELDAEVFRTRLTNAREAHAAGELQHASDLLSSALLLWRGPPLADVAFEDFAQAEIRHLEELHLEALEARAEVGLDLGHHHQLIAELEALLTRHPTRERLAAQLMLALYRCGRQSDALGIYQRTRERLAEELGIGPGPALQELQATVLAQSPTLVRPTGQSSPAPLDHASFTDLVARKPLVARPPSPSTPTVGREHEIRAVGELLTREDVRLVTILGTGGVGKTRVAVEAARSLARSFRDGTCWVELAGVTSPSDVASSVARALAISSLPSEDSRDALCRYLVNKRLLLVVDNFEQVLEAATLISELLAEASRLTVLATSREALDLAAEHRFALRPLPVPQISDEVSLAEVESSEASELFIAAARRRDAQFTLTPETAPAVAKISRLLDGLPLALELAAARTGTFGVDELSAQLEEAAVDLAGGPRDAPSRHKTLRETIDWSYRLLDQAQASTFARFGVFAGGASLDAAMAVTCCDAGRLEALVAKSLIESRKRPDASARFVMLEMIREYALEVLSASSQGEEARRRHLEHYLRVAERTVQHISTHRESAAMATIDSELDNLEAALRWALEHEPRTALRLAGALGDYWWVRGTRDGLTWIDAAIGAAGEAAPASDRARAQLARAYQFQLRRRDHQAEEPARAALEIYRELDDHAGMSDAYEAICWVRGPRATEDPEYRELAEAACRHARLAGDDGRLGNATIRLLSALPPEERPAVLTEVSKLLTRTGNYRALAIAHNNAGWLAIEADRPHEALEFLATSLRAGETIDLTRSIMTTCGNIGLASLFVGDLPAARAAFVRQLKLCLGHAFPRGADEGLAGIAALCASEGRHEPAARMLGTAHTLGFPEPGEKWLAERLEREYFTPAIARCGADAWRRDEELGGLLSYEAAITYALKHAAELRAGGAAERPANAEADPVR